MICVDEFGQLNLLPCKEKAWRPQARPRRLRATYHRHDGAMQMLAALDLATGKLFYRIRPRVSGLPQDPAGTLGRREVVRDVRQLLVTTPTSAPGARTTRSSWSTCRLTGPG